MDTKETIVVVGVGAVLAFGAYVIIRKMGDAQVAAQAQTVQQPATLPTYNPVVTAYTPVGLNPPGSPATNTPPGVDPSHVDLAVVKAPPPVDLPAPNLGDHGAHAPDAGAAVQPSGSTADHVSNTPALTGNAALVDAEYQKLFGRHAEEAGLNFWANQLNAGTLKSDDLEKRLIQGAQNQDVAASVANAPDLVIKYRTNA
jgi:hypothetical protein